MVRSLLLANFFSIATNTRGIGYITSSACLSFLQFCHKHKFLVVFQKVCEGKDTRVAVKLLKDVYFPQYVILLVAFLQHELECTCLLLGHTCAFVHNTILASVWRANFIS